MFSENKRTYTCLPVKDGYTCGHSVQYKMPFVYMYIDLLKLKVYIVFENSDADLSWLLF